MSDSDVAKFDVSRFDLFRTATCRLFINYVTLVTANVVTHYLGRSATSNASHLLIY